MITEIDKLDDLPNKGKVVLDFYGTFCRPCLMLLPKLKSISEKSEFVDVQFFKVNIEEANILTQSFDIEAVPTIIFMNEGAEIDRVLGANTDEINRKIEELVAL